LDGDVMDPITETTTLPDDKAKDDSGAPTPPSALDEQGFVEHVLLWHREAHGAKKEIFAKRKRAFEVYAGKQWAEDDERIAKLLKRPALTLNMVLSIISAVEGEEREERQDIKFFGAGDMADLAAFGLNRLLKWVMYQCGGEFSLSRMFREGIIGGAGWAVPEVDYLEDPEGQLKLLFVDDDEVLEDPLAKCPVFSDGRYLIRVKKMTREEMDARWPGSSDKVDAYCQSDADVIETDGKGYRDIYSAPGDITSPKLYDQKTKLWTVMEIWWHQVEPGWVVRDDETGMLEERSPEEFEQIRADREQQLRDALAARVAAAAPPPMTAIVPGAPPPLPPVMPPMPKPIEAVQRPVKRFYSAFTCFKTVLERKPCPITRLKRFPYVPFHCIFDKTKNEHIGIVQQIIDPQLQHNVEQSVIVQLMQLMPKGSWMGPKGSFHNRREWETGLAQPGKLLEYNITRGKPEPVPVPPIPRHLIDMAFTRPQAMRDISGVNVELTGQRQGSDAGVVMEKRRKAAKTVLAPIFDNYRQTKIEIGKVLLPYLQTYISNGRTIAIIGEDGNPGIVQMTRDMAIGRYQVMIDEDDTYVNDREQSLFVLQTTLPNLMKAGIPITPEFIDLLPLSPKIRESWKRQIAWTMTVNNQLPPPGWNPGDPLPGQALPGMIPPGGPGPGAPPPGTQPPAPPPHA
jgi:hypothetical protein